MDTKEYFIPDWFDTHPNLNGLTINGYFAAQSKYIYESFGLFKIYLIKNSIYPKQIVELGTSYGGFSMFLEWLFPDVDITSYDISSKLTQKPTEKSKVKFYNLDIFSPNGVKEISSIIKKDGMTLVFCDNGNKIREFNLFAQFLKSNDFIFCHDYIETKEKFIKEIRGKFWNWHESNYNDIKGALKNYNIQPFMIETFTKSFWFCGRKI